MEIEKLSEPFSAADIEWRLQRAGKTAKGLWAMALAYVTNRAIMERLDTVCGPQNWRNEFKDAPGGGILCGLSVRVERLEDDETASYGEWVTKWDGADQTEIEAVKGGLSGAMKRAGVQWGIGRYLYNLDTGWADCYADKKAGQYQGKTKEGEWFSWNPPRLPNWALPDGEKSNQQGPPKQTPPPANGGGLADEEVARLMDLIQGADSDAAYKAAKAECARMKGQMTPQQAKYLGAEVKAAGETFATVDF